LIDEITVIAGPILAMMIGIDVIITATTAAIVSVLDRQPTKGRTRGR
jgi:hypothetical protein